MIKCLQSLRGIFAFMIFLNHVPVFPAGGDWGVTFFFMLSGFLLCRRYAEECSVGSFDYVGFLRRRLSRVYPLHWLCLFIFFAVFAHFSLANGKLVMLCNVLLLQSWVPDVNYYFSYYPLAWFLSDIVLCYALFPLLMRVNPCRRSHCIFLVSGLAAYLLLVAALPERLLLPLVYVSPSLRWIDFFAGILLCRVMMRQTAPQRMTPALASLAEAGVVAVMCVALLLYRHVPERYGLASYWWLPSALLIGSSAFFDTCGGVLTRLLGSRLAVAFGNLSLYFYMAHGLVLIGVRDVLAHIGCELHLAVFIVVSFLLSVLGALFLRGAVRQFERALPSIFLR